MVQQITFDPMLVWPVKEFAAIISQRFLGRFIGEGENSGGRGVSRGEVVQ